MATSRNSKTGPSSQSTFLLEEHPAKVSQSPDCERDWATRVATWPSSFLALLTATAPHGSFGKMSPECIPLGQMKRTVVRPRQQERLEQLLDDWQSRPDLTPLQQRSLELLRKRTRPATLTASSPAWQNSATGSPHAFLTLSTPVWRSGASVCSLSDILEDSGSVPQRFFLTPKACAGILRRAGRRGKELPTALRQALEQVAGDSAGPETPEDKTP